MRRALRGLRQGRVHPLRWALFLFCAGEAAALCLLVLALAETVAASPAGWHWRHAILALVLGIAAVASMRSWPRWQRTLQWRCTALMPAPDGKGPLRVRLETPDGIRREASVRGLWQAGGAAVLRVVSRAPGVPGAIYLPWQAATPDLARRLQRAARVALRVQPDQATTERIC